MKFNSQMETLKITAKKEFVRWLGKSDYKLINLDDESVWVIREGKQDKRYIHFHPARNSPNAIRIHGNSWKTAIVLNILKNQ